LREKVIFNGRVDIQRRELESSVNHFLMVNFIALMGIHLEIEVQGIRHLWVHYPSAGEGTGEKIVNGYLDLINSPEDADRIEQLRIVSCRPELDILFFQLSQQIQARYVLPGYPPDILAIPLSELLEQGLISSHASSMSEMLAQFPDPDDTVKKYGTDRNLTASDVRRHVRRCLAYKENGGTVRGYHENLGPCPPFALETLRSWLKDPRFKTGT